MITFLRGQILILRGQLSFRFLLKTDEIEEEDLKKLSQIQTELIELEKESEEQETQIEIPPKQN